MKRFQWSRALTQRLVPKSRYARIFLATFAAALFAFLLWYKPWEAHYQGLPSSHWAGVLLARERHAIMCGTGSAMPTGYLERIEGWFSAIYAGGPDFTDVDFKRVLEELLHHPDPEVRRIAAQILCRSGSRYSRRALPVLLESLRTHADTATRTNVAWTIAASCKDDPDAFRLVVPELLRCYEAETDQAIRYTIVQILRNLDPKSADWPPLVYDFRFESAYWTRTVVDNWGLAYDSADETGDWSMVVDPTTPSHTGYSLTQRSSSPFTHRFVISHLDARNVALRVAIKAMGGRTEQGGGVLWRHQFTDNPADKYYAAGVNPRNGSLSLYKVEAGAWTQLGAREGLKLAVDQWHELSVTHIGDKIECALDGTKYIEVTNASFPDGGQIGLWTKTDAQTYFDGLRLTDFGPPSEPNKP
jgi:hypothetical protein